MIPLSNATIGRFQKLYARRGDGTYVDVSTLGGGGGGDSTLEPRVASLETSLPQQANQESLDEKG